MMLTVVTRTNGIVLIKLDMLSSTEFVMHHSACVLLVTYLVTAGISSAQTPGIFFDFGAAAGDTALPTADDDFSSPISLSMNFSFFARSSSTLFVSNF